MSQSLSSWPLNGKDKKKRKMKKEDRESEGKEELEDERGRKEIIKGGRKE